jgi:hypothetical protein
MSEPLFDIVFYGITQPGKERDVVVENMAALFKTTPDKVKPYFAGGRKVIKSNVDELTAEKYSAALENVGLVIKLEGIEQAEETDETSTSATESSQQESAADDDSGISVAPVGADVLENPPEVTPQPIGDISDISMAEVGADVLENPPEVEAQPIGDISDISMAEVGADMIENQEPKEVAPVPDTSELSVKDK